MIEEITLLIAHLLVLFFRSGTLLDSGAFCDMETNPDYEAIAVPPLWCAIVATALHYLYLVRFFAFMQTNALLCRRTS